MERRTALERAMFAAGINLTDFDDELAENNIPYIDLQEPSDLSAQTFFMVRAYYVFPGVELSDFSADVLSSYEYQLACQPTSRSLPTKVWDDCAARGDVRTFRITKCVVPLVLKFT
eukprot:gene10789-7515_t